MSQNQENKLIDYRHALKPFVVDFVTDPHGVFCHEGPQEIEQFINDWDNGVAVAGPFPSLKGCLIKALTDLGVLDVEERRRIVDSIIVEAKDL